MQDKVYAAIDMGSGTIKLVVGSVSNDQVNVYKTTKIRTSANGFKQGQIINMGEVAKNIKKAVEEMKAELKIDITHVALSVPPINLKMLKTSGFAKVMSENKIITEKTLKNALESAKSEIDTITYTIVQNKPLLAFVDKVKVGLDKIIGTHGEEIEIQSDIYTIPKVIYEKYKQTLLLAGLKLSTFATSSIAIANEVVVNKIGPSVLVDVGHHSTTVSTFYSNTLFNTQILPIAGKHITHDINSLMNIGNYGTASTFKHKYIKLGVKNNTKIYFDDYGKQYDITFLNKIATRRVIQILKQIKKITDKIITNNEEIDFIFTGGSALLFNLDKLAEKILNNPVRIYSPNTIGANTPDFTTTIGMIYLIHKYSQNNMFFTEVEGLNTQNWFNKKKNFSVKLLLAKFRKSKEVKNEQ